VPGGGEVLGARALNRALLERQGLLARRAVPVLDMVERLVGLQAQMPDNPYLGLWSRLCGFGPAGLSALLAERRVARAQVMRSTIHLVSARDCRPLLALTAPVRAQTFRNGWSRGLRGADLEEVVGAGLALMAERPRTRAELAALLAPRWPRAQPAALAHAVTFNAALVQVPPRGLWGRRGQATWAGADTWLGGRADGAALDGLVLRYLAAFGPATVADLRTWSGLTGLRAVVEGLRRRLVTFRDERGRELLDVPGAPLPDPETPAPPRFLPEYDNVLLSHEDRSRVVGEVGPTPPRAPEGTVGTVLVDGFSRARWALAVDGETATLTVDGVPREARDEVAAEGEALLAFLAADRARRLVLRSAP